MSVGQRLRSVAILVIVASAFVSGCAAVGPNYKRPDIAPPAHQLESWERLRFFESLAHVFRAATPLVLVVDDLQWADGDTIEWLHYFLRSAFEARCLVVGTVRAACSRSSPVTIA